MFDTVNRVFLGTFYQILELLHGTKPLRYERHAQDTQPTHFKTASSTLIKKEKKRERRKEKRKKKK
jgi:CelD/BcsL family acetyltransferase involved in cellulose biosynthesis